MLSGFHFFCLHWKQTKKIAIMSLIYYTISFNADLLQDRSFSICLVTMIYLQPIKNSTKKRSRTQCELIYLCVSFYRTCWFNPVLVFMRYAYSFCRINTKAKRNAQVSAHKYMGCIIIRFWIVEEIARCLNEVYLSVHNFNVSETIFSFLFSCLHHC